LKGFRRHAALPLFGRARLDGFAFDVEILFVARRLGLAVTQVPVLPPPPGLVPSLAEPRSPAE